MYEAQTILIERQLAPPDSMRTLTIARPESTFIETLTLGDGVAYSTDVPDPPVVPAPKSSSPSSIYVGAILSGVVAFVVLVLVVWVCCRKGNKRSRRKGPDSGSQPGSNSSSSSSESSEDASASSQDGSVQSVVDDAGWEPPPDAGQWAGPPPGMGPAGMGPPGMTPAGMAPPTGMAPPGMGPPGTGPPMTEMPMGRGGPPPFFGGGGGPPPSARQL
ncbi:hypothetical protein F4777DRAFT_584274 [Nemania sp. FL0916]|nr:hypothetical protein F4777DRAFT_584274 [Nemania sp. FL0916]